MEIQLYACMYILLGIHNPLEVDIYTDIDMNAIKKECRDLDKLLMSASDVEFDDLLGEGIITNIKL